MSRVYPRVCGGTCPSSSYLLVCVGLSPRVRGNLYRSDRRRRMAGSIPACAGEPCPGRPAPLILPVYPRVCGGTAEIPGNERNLRGLSPRVRGNRHPDQRGRDAGRSIPACAGEPRARTESLEAEKVYPRVCGGTVVANGKDMTDDGLSPRVRGNHTVESIKGLENGSIPACAGEPPKDGLADGTQEVYPRVCGGTAARNEKPVSVTGLSPRVRGNRGQPDQTVICDGSIPACAGEPRSGCWPVSGRRVYPRVCGGTLLALALSLAISGLSPRVRGNPLVS